MEPIGFCFLPNLSNFDGLCWFLLKKKSIFPSDDEKLVKKNMTTNFFLWILNNWIVLVLIEQINGLFHISSTIFWTEHRWFEYWERKGDRIMLQSLTSTPNQYSAHFSPILGFLISNCIFQWNNFLYNNNTKVSHQAEYFAETKVIPFHGTYSE